MSIIPATQEAKIGRITIQDQPQEKVHEAPSQLIKTRHGGICLLSQLCRRNK
jgi:hypothetical protein